ncbi:acidic mammalian chitinase-like protein [Cinnamomum micranthum f. kanehirae]|uniref:Acidic mammalian chitinase-like protein n=1 Tax=Cinnamomum micranthum f. kanehirae TaxID=337451 RepID=A0A3S3MUD2_9MAGN|nr:acidic mammalian chitinase-like protein [Cinnamomum micranthum f. kanehirae]
MANQTIIILLLLITIFYKATGHAKSPSPAPSLPFPCLPTPLSPSYPPSPAASTRRLLACIHVVDLPHDVHRHHLLHPCLYGFVLPDPTTYRININQQDDELLANFTTTLQGKVPPAKALLSIGGGGNNPAIFAQMASSAKNRAAFIDSTIAAARKYGLDGLDLDWEFPQSQEEMDNLGDLFEEWSAALAKEAAATSSWRLLLTAAVYFAAEFILADNRSYPSTSIRKNVDWVNAMCFDYHGTWNTSVTGAHAALYDPKSNVSTSFGLRSWVSAGVPAGKVVMGLPLYGRTWQLRDPAEHGVGAPAVGVGPGGGLMQFKDLMDYNVENNATEVYDGITVSTYSYSGTAWIGYDGAMSVKEKIYYAQGLHLGGYFFWALGYDKDWMISQRGMTTEGNHFLNFMIDVFYGHVGETTLDTEISAHQI